MAEPAGTAQRPGVQTTPCGMEVTDFILHDMVAALERSSDYPARHRAVAASLTPVKFGISFTLTHLNQAGALVHIYHDGSVHLNHGGTEMGHIEWDRIAGRGRPFYQFAYGAAATEVAVDTRTGENRILRCDILHDAGASLNPALDIGQIEGGYGQGDGRLATEELVWDQKGRLATHAPSTNKIPTASDRPKVFNVALYDAENRRETIYRSKAVGEPPLMLGISALMALSDACSACGPHYPALDAPATAE